MRTVLTLLASILCLPAYGRADDRIDYTRQIKPILKERCYACHGALKQKGRLRLDSGPAIHQGGKSGAAAAAHDPKASLLLDRVTESDPALRMPPEGKPLSPDQIDLLRNWITQGAPYPKSEKPEIDPRQHWSFQSPARPLLPLVKDAAWCRNPLDQLLLAEMEKNGLKPSPETDPATLLRRVYLDLVGMPPNRGELQAFLEDKSADAYERVVDRLLGSARYGERWARHWMDVWRYSDWYGRRAVPDVMNSYPRIWRWRDWIVRSLNEDKGYDRMILEMLAADELAPEDDSSIVATGFLVRNWFKWNYNQWMRDQVEHTGKAFLGLTLNCCHCHDHKYDPLTQNDYFAMRAIFEPMELRHDRVPGEADPGPFKKYVYAESYGPIASGMVRVFDEKLDARTFVYAKGDERARLPDRQPVAPAAPAFLGGERLEIKPVALPLAAWYPGSKSFVREEELAKYRQAAREASASLAAGLKQPQADLTSLGLNLRAARSRLAALEARVEADRAMYQESNGDVKRLSRDAGHAERQAAYDTALAELTSAEKGKQPKAIATARAKLEAALSALDEPVVQHTPISPQYPKLSTGRRLALGKWIASANNPLTARVGVNHIWGWHFGRPLVATTADFGRNGQLPSHPQMLDWLAVELMESGWRMKPLHRLLVTSAAYRMRSDASSSNPAQAKDPDNHWWWRFPLQRMEAEVVRDSILRASGSLAEQLGGAEIPSESGLTNCRRSLYFAHHGEGSMLFLELFDGVNPGDGYRRTTSVLPQQALALANSELLIRESRLLSERLSHALPEEFIRAAFEQVLARPAMAGEAKAAAAWLGEQEKLVRESAGESATARARALLIHALFNHHEFVTIR